MLEATLVRLQAEAGAMQWTAKGLEQRGAGPQKTGGGQREAEGAEGAEEAGEAEEAEEAEEVTEVTEVDKAEEAAAADVGQAAPLDAEEVRRVLASSSAVVGIHQDLT